MNTLIAVKSGYYFALVPSDYLHNIELEPTGLVVSIPEKHGSWPLYKGKTFEDAQKYDEVLDSNVFAIYETASYVVNKTPSLPNEKRMHQVIVSKTGIAYVECTNDELHDKVSALTESDITWGKDWSITDIKG